MSDDLVTTAAVWCPHNESHRLCNECMEKWLIPVHPNREDDE